jgi:geranylgeranyl reductase family protein
MTSEATEPGPVASSGPDHDVVIVGASVAGCRTALTLATHDVSVLLLDKADFPRWKPCAGGLTLKTRPYLPEPLFEQIECVVHQACLTYGEGYVTSIRSRNPLGWMVHRESFDETHLELTQARRTVEVSQGTTVRSVTEDDGGVTVDTDRGVLRARVLVGADGATSVVSRALPGHDRREMGFAYEGEVRSAGSSPPSQSDETVFDFRTFPHGYGWVFPKRDHESIGGYVYGRKLPGIKTFYREFCSETERLRGTETYRARGHPTSLGGDLRRLSSRRIVLVGEAGSMVDPLTGEGIYYALRSGHLAGEAIRRYLEDDVPLATYAGAVRQEIQADLRCARILAKFIYNHPGLAFRLLLRNALLCRWFTQVGAGTMSYRGLFRSAALKSPLLPFYARFSRQTEVQVKMPETRS